MFKKSMTIALSPKVFVPFLIVVALAVFFLTGGEKQSGGQGGFPPPAVSVAEVIVRDVIPWEEFTGRIEAKEVVLIHPRVGGVIEEISYREGDLVKKGDLLFIIDQQPFRAELNRAEADLARARAQADLAQSEVRRAKNLVKRKLLSQDEYDRRAANENQANATVRSAEATLQLAQLNLEYTEIRSPIDGRTGRALVTKGNLVAADPTPDQLTTVLSVDPVYVTFDSDELTYLRFLGKAQQSAGESSHDSDGNHDVGNAEVPDKGKERIVFVGLGNEDGFPHKGYVDFIDNRVAPETGTIRLRGVLENKERLFTPGLFARVKLLAAKPVQTFLVDERAILTDQDRKYIYVLGEGNSAMRRDIKTGRAFEGLRIVNEGMKPGDKVIVHGIQKIFFPNMPVMPQTIGMGDPPPSPGPAPEAGH